MDSSDASFNFNDLLNSTIQFKLGLKYMKGNVKEVDLAVRELSGSTLVGIFNLSSWKYPHEKIEDLDIPGLMDDLEKSGESEEMTYVHMSELLIDRLYYGLLSSIQYVNMLTGMIGQGEDNSFFKDAEGDNSCVVSQDHYQNTNLAGVVRKLHAKFRQLEAGIHKFKIDRDMAPRPLTSRTAKFQSSSIIISPETTAPIQKKTNTFAQTEESRINACASCETTQSVLKYIGDILEQSWKNLSNDEPSQIGLAKVEIRNDLIWGSQWGAVALWCKSMKIDTSNIVRKVSENIKANGILESKLQELQRTINRQNRDHDLAMEKSDRKVTRLLSSLDEIKKERSILLQFKSESEFKLQELQNQLSLRDQALDKHGKERKKLEKALLGLEKIHQELISSQKTTSEDMNQIKYHLECEKKSKIQLQNKVKELETHEKAQEARQLKLAEENKKLHNEINTLREQMDRELSSFNEKLELLTLFPDLNGPINPPSTSSIETEPGNIVGAMEKQVQSNSLRIQILHQQSSKLNSTLDKLKAFVYHM